MRTAEEIRERYIHIAELNDIDKAEIEVAIQITQTESWNESAIEELTKAKWEANKTQFKIDF